MGDEDSFSCPYCSQEHFHQKINWRRKAGFSNFFIEIRGVFESDAIPSDELLQILSGLTNSKWGYFYADETAN